MEKLNISIDEMAVKVFERAQRIAAVVANRASGYESNAFEVTLSFDGDCTVCFSGKDRDPIMISNNELLEETEYMDKQGFVFEGEDDGLPYWCSLAEEGQVWFYRWHEHQQNWVTLKRVFEEDIVKARKSQLTDESANVYHELNNQFQSA